MPKGCGLVSDSPGFESGSSDYELKIVFTSMSLTVFICTVEDNIFWKDYMCPDQFGSVEKIICDYLCGSLKGKWSYLCINVEAALELEAAVTEL